MLYEVITVSEGDLQATSDIDSKDEIGQMSAMLNNMVLKLKEIVIDISRGSDSIIAAGVKLNVASEKMAQGANHQASSLEEVSSTSYNFV